MKLELPKGLLDVEFRFVRIVEFGRVTSLMQYRKKFSDGVWTAWEFPPVLSPEEAIAADVVAR